MTTMKKNKVSTTQEDFLNYLRVNKVPSTVFLGNGIKLQGVVYSFDFYSIVLKRGADLQLIYKHSIATIVPSRTVDLNPDNLKKDTSSELLDDDSN